MNRSKLNRLSLILESKLFDGPSRIVKLLEFLVVSGCPYCSAIRAILFGYGIGRGDLLGIGLVILAVFVNHLEKWIRDE